MLDKIKSLLSDYEKAVARFNEAIHSNIESDLVMDATIQRFEFTFELSWKLMQSYLNYQGIVCVSPRQVIKETFKLELLSDGDTWIDMLMDRNRTSHIYDEQEARIIYEKIKSKHAPKLNSFLNQIKTAIHELSHDVNEQEQ